ncbi:MAG: ATP-dependent sacrificial sulfur transferase LarE, partial [Longimicrobiales bacterium]
MTRRNDISEATRRKHDQLLTILRGFDSVCVGYSGGVDSVFLTAAAVDALGPERVVAVTGRSEAYPQVQRDAAVECARVIGVRHLEIETDEVRDPRYAANPSNRCYYCKAELWTRLRAVAEQRGIAVVLDGSNADDAHDYRPGMRAASEHGVRSPLLEAGLTKSEIRALSGERGLPSWDRPSSPCLSSRIPYGIAVTPERLAQVEAAERMLRDHGFREFRVRHHGDVARIETAPAERGRAIDLARTLDTGLRALGFTSVLLDVEGYRRGALNEALPLVPLVRLGAA